MNRFETTQEALRASPRIWAITGVAGFIGSNLLETLLRLEQRVVGLDNFSTGLERNLEEVRQKVSAEQWRNFQFHRGDICNPDDCRNAMLFVGANDAQAVSVDFVLHQAALGSVPRSVENPRATNAANIDGFLNVMIAARDAGVQRLVYAASSSTYGDHPGIPKTEELIGKPLSPYAVTKLVNELYAEVFARTYGFKSIGLRYFNVFGPRQQPDGPYAAVIPKWIDNILRGEPVVINGDGFTSRDFCFVDNAVQANLLAATSPDESANEIYNVAVGDQHTLLELCAVLRAHLSLQVPQLALSSPVHRAPRVGDVRHSKADISKASRLLGYTPSHRFADGIAQTVHWYVSRNSTYMEGTQ